MSGGIIFNAIDISYLFQCYGCREVFIGRALYSGGTIPDMTANLPNLSEIIWISCSLSN
jgi:hypothetical protein